MKGIASVRDVGYGVHHMRHTRLVRPSELRLLWTSLVFTLLILATVNVAFAVTRIRSRTSPPPPVVDDGLGVTPGARGWIIRTPHKDPWPDPTGWTKRGRFGLREYAINWQNPIPNTNGFQLSLQHMGWPLPVLEIKQMWWDWNDPALQGPEPDPRPHLVPLGLVANPVLVGLPLWTVLIALPIGLVFVRRVRRARRGRCAWCGYELLGAELCPECGPTSDTVPMP